MDEINSTIIVNNSDTYLDFNVSDEDSKRNETLESFENFFGLWFIGIYFFILAVGVFANLFLIMCLILQKKQGTTYLILQLSIIDIISTAVAISEIWSQHIKTWSLYANLCPVFLGTEILVNVLTVYQHILLNFHAISTYNLQNNTEVSNMNPLTSKLDEATEFLAPNRTLSVDYRHKKTSVSIILPSILLWFTCLSLSIPEYTLSVTVRYQIDRYLCTIVDLHYTRLFQILLGIFRDFLPVPLLLLTFFTVLYKLCNKNSLSAVKKNISAKKFNDLQKLLYLSVILSLLYIITSFQRSILHFLHILTKNFDKNNLENFKMPPLNNVFVTNLTNLFLSMFHYSAIVLRPFICIIIMPSIIKIFTNYVCRKKEKNSN